jgi:5,6-dimethylbenzimidazole synthase
MPEFDAPFRSSLEDLIAWRRDVRRFRDDPVAPELLDRLLDLACLAPSVGNSQPWRFVMVEAAERRARIVEVFERCNRAALEACSEEKAGLYARLKLSGLQEAPVHLAVFAEEATAAGHGLGRRTMPETLRYSTVLAVHTLWLAARAYGLGVGWVSILDPPAVVSALETPADWSLVAYLCIGYPVEEHLDPELERHGWQAREATCRKVLSR